MTQLKKAKVCILDDDIAIRESLSWLLEIHGFEALAFDSWQTYMNHDSTTPDVYIIDFYMPEKNGIEIIKLLRDSNSTTPIILTSGHLDNPFATEVKKYQNITTLAKPFRQDQLLNMLKNQLLRDSI